MRIEIYKIILWAIFISACNLYCQSQPHYHQTRYRSECWMGEGYSYSDDAFPDSGFFATTDIEPNEPLWGYPFHSGVVKGVSDTTIIAVHFRNFNDTPYGISSLLPKDWFTPVIYHQNSSPRTSKPIADTSNFDIGFKYWSNWGDDIVTQPKSIPPAGDGNEEYLSVYYVWNLPVGRNRLCMKTTSLAPTGFRLLISNTGIVWVTKPTDLADTLNAHNACFWRARLADDDSAALAWTDTMLTYNQYSIPGYLLNAYAHSDFSDSLAKVTALDSAIAIAERYGDPVVPDTSEMDVFWKLWYEDILNHMKYYRWKHITGNEKMINL